MKIFSNDALASSSYKIADEFGDIGIKSIYALTGFPNKESIKTKKQQKRRTNIMSSMRFIRPLEKAAEETNRRMERKKLPLHIACYQKEKRVFLEVVFQEKHLIRDITDDDFSKWIHNITEAKGLLFDG